MKKIILLLSLWLGWQAFVSAQQPMQVQSGFVSFLSEAPISTISAVNRHISGIVDLNSGSVQITFEMQQFRFENSLMQEHFNTDFVHADVYPMVSFSGCLLHPNALPENWSGTRHVEVEGLMTFHGKSQKMRIKGTLTRSNNKLIVKAAFPLTLSEFDVRIPTILTPKIAKVVEVNVDLNCRPLEPR